MALTDSDKDFLRIPIISAAFFDVLGKTSGIDTFNSAAAAIKVVPVETIAEALAALRTDEVFIEAGSMEIGDGVEIELYDEED
jgi:carbamoylphosphate synthase small subunit|tara:strand:- start:284 stop:532 length:249 start_codon:yes stop_codon:yes gene_type:complete